MKRYVLTLTMAAGLLACSLPAFGLTLLAEDFNDVTGLSGPGTDASTLRTVQNIVTTTPGELPTGTTWSPTDATGRTYLDVRRTDNSINHLGTVTTGTNVSPANFNSYFTPINSTDHFLVVGDVSGALNREPFVGTSYVTMPFTKKDGKIIHVAFQYAFNGYDQTSPLLKDEAKIFLSDNFGHTLSLVDSLSTYRLRTAATKPNYAEGLYSQQIVLPANFVGNNLKITFELIEASPNANDTLKDSALGVDNIIITQVVPEPSTFLLVAAGMGGLLFLGRGRRKQ